MKDMCLRKLNVWIYGESYEKKCRSFRVRIFSCDQEFVGVGGEL